MKKLYILLVILLLILPVMNLRAQEVDLLWQGETYVSPFYKGKALWSSQSKVNLLAIPHGLSNPANLIYKWTKNGTVLGNVSGVGRNTLSFADMLFSKPQTIKVEILSQDEVVVASTTLTLTPASQTLAVYENHPLYGFMFHRETGGVHELREQEVTFAAFPLFFSVTNRMDAGINYEWRTNAGGLETANSVTYRAPDDATGSSQVQVSASNVSTIKQEAKKGFLVQFGNQ